MITQAETGEEDLRGTGEALPGLDPSQGKRGTAEGREEGDRKRGPTVPTPAPPAPACHAIASKEDEAGKLQQEGTECSREGSGEEEREKDAVLVPVRTGASPGK